MKKIVIILSAILLNVTFCFAQDVTFKKTEPQIITLNKSFDITLNNPTNTNKEFNAKSSNEAVIKIDSLTQSIIWITGIEYGYAYIEVNTIKDTIKRKFIVSDNNAFEAMTDTITSLRGQLLQVKEQAFKPTEEKEELKEIRELPYDIISYMLIALILSLLVLLFIVIKKKNAKIMHHKRKEDVCEAELSGIKLKNNELLIEVNNISSENKKLTEKIRLLHGEIEQIRNNERPKTQISTPVQPQPQSLYADAIIDGKLYRVKEQPDDDTIFELKLNREGDTRAVVTVYVSAYRRVIANPSFLEGCEKQILGTTTVTMQRDGVATKDGSGKWTITTPPEVKIS